MSKQDIANIVTIEPGRRYGKPCIPAMRITVHNLLEYFASGMNDREILDNFPYFTQQDILAYLSFS